MTEREYRQDDLRDTGYCPKCGEPLSGLTVAARGYCDTHGWQWADWHASGYWSRLPTTSDRDLGDETDAPDNLIPGVMTGKEKQT